MPQPVARQIAPPANTTSVTHGLPTTRLLRTENPAINARTALAASPKARFHESLKQVEARSRETSSESIKSEGPSRSRADRIKNEGKAPRATKGKRRADAAAVDDPLTESDDIAEAESSRASTKDGLTATPTDEASAAAVAGVPGESDEPSDDAPGHSAHLGYDLPPAQDPQGAAKSADIPGATEQRSQDTVETTVVDPDAAAPDDADPSSDHAEASADAPAAATVGDAPFEATAIAAQAAQASATESIASHPGAGEPAAATVFGSRATTKPAFGASPIAADPESAETGSATSAQVTATGPAAGAPADGAFQQFLDEFDPASTPAPSPHGRDGQDSVGGLRSADLFNSSPTTAREAAAPKLAAAAAPPAPELPPEARFAAENHEKIVTGVRGELLPNGGTMRLRLDPPELGTLQVSLHMRNGVVTAAFETANNDAARMLSHTLGDLRATLESHGITVDKLHVQQSPRDEGGASSRRDDSERPDQTFEQQQESRREQQRRDAVQRIWDKLAGIAPIDLVA